MNSRRITNKLLGPAALALASALSLAAGVGAVRDRLHSRPRTEPQDLRVEVTGETESGVLRLRSLVMRGGKLREEGRYEEAKLLLREALALAEKTFGPDSFETAKVLNELGVLGKYQGDFEGSEAAYRRALRIIENTTGLNHSMAATLFHNLGGLEHARGRFPKASPTRAAPSKSASGL